jgi:hypothetical protein
MTISAREQHLPAVACGSASAGSSDRLAGIALMTGSAASNQLGAATAALAFPALGPAGVVAVRQWVAAAVLLTAVRPKIATFTWQQWRAVLALALIFATMNLSLGEFAQNADSGRPGYQLQRDRRSGDNGRDHGVRCAVRRWCQGQAEGPRRRLRNPCGKRAWPAMHPWPVRSQQPAGQQPAGRRGAGRPGSRERSHRVVAAVSRAPGLSSRARLT